MTRQLNPISFLDGLYQILFVCDRAHRDSTSGFLSLLLWPRGYKLFFMLNSAEHEMCFVYKS